MCLFFAAKRHLISNKFTTLASKIEADVSLPFR
jgi:hypothetical protein